jgi:dipeptidyl aminopeptidase/acylaminoacyl peptidase
MPFNKFADCFNLVFLGGSLLMAASASPEQRVRSFLEVALSPGGELIASIEGNRPLAGYEPVVRSLAIRRVRSGATTWVSMPCGTSVDCWPGSPVWMPDGSHLVFTLRMPGSHGRSIYSVGADGSGLTRLAEFSGTIDQLKIGPNGALAFLATEGANKEIGATQARAPTIGDSDEPPREQRIAILDAKALHWISPADLFVYEFDWRPDGRGFVGTAARGDGDNNWWVAKLYTFDTNGTTRVIYDPPDTRHQIAVPRVSRDGRAVAFIAGLMSDFGSTGGDVYRLPVSGGQAENLTAGLHASATSIAWNCDGHLLVKFLNGPNSELAELTDDGRAEHLKILWAAPETIEGKDGGVSLACPSSMTATVRESYTVPPEIATGPIGHWNMLTKVNGGLTVALRVQNLEWKSDGLNIQGWLLLPERRKAAKLPMITIVHGGPAAAAVPLFQGPGPETTLLRNGYAVFRPNPRGSFGQGEAFTAANVRDFGYGDLRDILAGIKAAEHAAPIDDARLGIVGGSYGAYLTMWTVTQSHIFRAAVAIAGISDWLSYYGENGVDGWMIPYFGSSVYEAPELYARSSPINFINNVTTPTFEYVGEGDIECPPSQSLEYWHALKALGVPTSLVIYPREGHGLHEPDHLADATRRTLAWFDKYLQ